MSDKQGIFRECADVCATLLPHTPMSWVAFLLSWVAIMAGGCFKVALGKCSPKGKNTNIYVFWQKHVFIENQENWFRWETELWGGKREGTQNKNIVGFVVPAVLLLFEWWRRLICASLDKKSAWAPGVVNSLDISSKLVPLLSFLFYTQLFWCSHDVDTFVFLSSVNQHPCRTEKVEGANLSKAGSRYPVILHCFFSFLYESLVSTLFI